MTGVRILACALLIVSLSTAARGSVLKIFVTVFGTSEPARHLRQDLIAELQKDRSLRLVANASEADAILSGSGDLWVKGYYSLNPRIRYLNSDAQPIYGGFLSVELKDAHDETLWSYLATPRRFGPSDIGKNLATQIVKKLKAAIDGLPAAPSKP